LANQTVQRQNPLPPEQLPGPSNPSSSNNERFQLGFVSILLYIYYFYYMKIINFLATFKITVHTFYFLQPQKHHRNFTMFQFHHPDSLAPPQ
jgi:hypothetical protein